MATTNFSKVPALTLFAEEKQVSRAAQRSYNDHARTPRSAISTDPSPG